MTGFAAPAIAAAAGGPHFRLGETKKLTYRQDSH
jgi:hypothetical protein